MGRFKPGQSGNPAGKPKGIEHKPRRLRQMISEFLNDNFDQVMKDYKALEPKERIKVYTDLLAYGAPKLQALNVTNDIQTQLKTFYSDDELLELMDQMIKHKTIHIKQLNHGQTMENLGFDSAIS